jgi:hypothetical protein
MILVNSAEQQRKRRRQADMPLILIARFVGNTG